MSASAVELRRAVDALLGPDLWAALVAAALVVAVAAVATRRGVVREVPWPLLVVVAVLLALRGRMLVPVVAALVGGLVLGRVPHRGERGQAVLVLASGVTALGLFACLPDTEQAIAALAAIAVVGIVRATGAAGDGAVRWHDLGALLGLLVWVCFAGDGGRTPALFGGLLCVGLLFVVAAMRHLPALVLGSQVVATGLAARWVGLAPDLATAVQRALPVVMGVAAVVLAAVSAARRGRRR